MSSVDVARIVEAGAVAFTGTLSDRDIERLKAMWAEALAPRPLPPAYPK